ncbi:hypothetical protein BSKO_12969 [Bryopsis sp. KO-2023]|nr:hypothetical protein BSKO_12969 [Bryopsis sp. KO-2023]
MSHDSERLTNFVDKIVSVVTNDGRIFVGTLKGYDQSTNVILFSCHERVYSTEVGVEQLLLGTYVIRGDSVAMVGEIDGELDKRIDLSQIRAPPLKSIMHTTN